MAQAPIRINRPPRPLPDLAIKTCGLGKTYGGSKVAEALRGIYLDISCRVRTVLATPP